MLARILIERLRSLILRRWEYPPKNPNILWSKGWYSVADWSGDNNYAYPAYPTRYRIQSLKRLVGKQGIIWLRLGSDPPKPEFENGAPGDLVIFARDVIGKLSGPVVLITTDGDRTIPTGLPDDVVQKIVDDTNIKVWFSQNLVTPSSHPKLRSLPIGIDLHTPMGRFTRTNIKAELFKSAIRNSSTSENRVPRVWSDVHLEPDLGDLVGEPRGLLTESRDELRDGINTGALAGIVDSPTGRIPLQSAWKKYGGYEFVMSLPGHGLDCHRTWEALALGATVITIHSPLDNLLRPYRVVFIERKTKYWWKVMMNADWFDHARRVVDRSQKFDIRMDAWISMLHKELSINS